MFSQEQLDNFVSQRLIKEKLLKEFHACLNSAKDAEIRRFIEDRLGEDREELASQVWETARFTCKFYYALHSFILQKVSFIDAIYDKMGREHVANFWRQLLGQVYSEMGKRLEAELGAGR